MTGHSALPGVDAPMSAGFAEPVRQSQAAFRAAMHALARPGDVTDFPVDLVAPMPREMAALALTLLDFETTFWLAPSLSASPEVAEYLQFHTGASRTTMPAAAAFAFLDLTAGDSFDPADFAQGTAEYPDRSTTIIVWAGNLTPIAGLRASGPGISGEKPFGLAPMPDDFIRCWASNRAAFPMGVDLLLVTAGKIAGLPRSTRLTAEG